MKKETCKCGNDTFFIESYCVNGGGAANRICTKCGEEEELYDTYNDQN